MASSAKGCQRGARAIACELLCWLSVASAVFVPEGEKNGSVKKRKEMGPAQRSKWRKERDGRTYYKDEFLLVTKPHGVSYMGARVREKSGLKNVLYMIILRGSHCAANTDN